MHLVRFLIKFILRELFARPYKFVLKSIPKTGNCILNTNHGLTSILVRDTN